MQEWRLAPSGRDRTERRDGGGANRGQHPAVLWQLVRDDKELGCVATTLRTSLAHGWHCFEQVRAAGIVGIVFMTVGIVFMLALFFRAPLSKLALSGSLQSMR